MFNPHGVWRRRSRRERAELLKDIYWLKAAEAARREQAWANRSLPARIYHWFASTLLMLSGGR